MIAFIKKHKKGLIGTIAFHGILAILIFTMGFSTPLPLPAEQGILINFGNVENAGGETEPQKSLEKSEKQSQQQPSPQQPEQKQTEQKAEKIATQDHEEAPAVKERKEKSTQETEKKEPEKKQQETKKEPQEKQIEEKKPEKKVNKKALYPGKSKEQSDESEGETEGKGNQGKESGSPLSDNYADKGSKGMGGIDYSLQGRNPESLPKPDYNYQIEGKVVVEITVDKYGNVTKAVPGAKGSTTLNDNLLKAAKKAALNAKFDRKPSAPAYQKGTITYYFRLQ